MKLQQLSSWVGLLTVAVSIGFLNAERPASLSVVEGEAWVRGGKLTMLPGAQVWVGEGQRLELEGHFPEGEIELISGQAPEPVVVGHVGVYTGLYSEQLVPLSALQGEPWKGEGKLSLSCVSPRQFLQVPDRPVAQAEGMRCQPRRLFVRARALSEVRGLWVDGVPVQLEPRGFSVGWGLGGVGVAAGLGLGLGWLGWQGGVLMPLVLLAPSVQLPMGLLLVGVGALVLFLKQRESEGWRRSVVWLLLTGVLGGGLLFLRGRDLMQWPSYQVASVLADRQTVEQKVVEGLGHVRAYMQAHPSSLRQVVALGSSSSGGGTPGRFWPQRVQEGLPNVQVIPVTQGGATTWHLREMLERLPLTPVLCILYAGHNDNTRSFPGQTIAGLMRGDVPVVQQFVAPVSLQEAQENVRAMVSKCGQLWVIPEYSKQLEAEQVAYGAALAAVPGVTLLDAASRLRAMPVEWMLDDVHPSPEGQGVLAAYVLEQLAQRKPELLKP